MPIAIRQFHAGRGWLAGILAAGFLFSVIAVAQEETPAEEAATAAPAAKEEKENVAKNIALFFAAPFIGLAYIIAFPFVGFYALLRMSYRAATSNRPDQGKS